MFKCLRLWCLPGIQLVTTLQPKLYSINLYILRHMFEPNSGVLPTPCTSQLGTWRGFPNPPNSDTVQRMEHMRPSSIETGVPIVFKFHDARSCWQSVHYQMKCTKRS
ncbi:hypothetical protein B0H34DRAFT_68034 [Crassisporium funariophilum]|nr:hypothetical protein B0H34DRAFT_68034 [Crassisporium funariophilum]